tara:strand:- start:6809 stop:7702 length:894 start_codon:yes stop_codon:yes gene_type:complete
MLKFLLKPIIGIGIFSCLVAVLPEVKKIPQLSWLASLDPMFYMAFSFGLAAFANTVFKAIFKVLKNFFFGAVIVSVSSLVLSLLGVNTSHLADYKLLAAIFIGIMFMLPKNTLRFLLKPVYKIYTYFKFKLFYLKYKGKDLFKTIEEVDDFGKVNGKTVNNSSYIKGQLFENYIRDLYRAQGYEAYTTADLRESGQLPKGVQGTAGSGEQGVDVVYFYKNQKGDKKKVIVQCKHYSHKVSNSAIQEIHTARNLYNADKCKVITNNKFTEPAKTLAKSCHVELIDREGLQEFILKAVS